MPEDNQGSLLEEYLTRSIGIGIVGLVFLGISALSKACGPAETPVAPEPTPKPAVMESYTPTRATGVPNIEYAVHNLSPKEVRELTTPHTYEL